MLHDYVSVLLQNGQSDEEMELAALEIGPECLPQTKNIRPFKFAFVPHEKHSEEEEEIRRVGGLKVKV